MVFKVSKEPTPCRQSVGSPGGKATLDPPDKTFPQGSMASLMRDPSDSVIYSWEKQGTSSNRYPSLLLQQNFMKQGGTIRFSSFEIIF